MRRVRRSWFGYAALLFSGLAAWPLVAQEGLGRPSVYFDCQTRGCNGQYVRTEIGWVNWVRDKEVSEVHLLVTSQETGAGGQEFVLDFMGAGASVGYADRHVFRARPTDTERERLDGVVLAIGLGLAQYALESGYRGLVAPLEAGAASDPGVVSAEEVEDPWNLWVFEVGGGASLGGESTYNTTDFSSELSVSRVTPTWQYRLNAGGSYRRISIDLADSTFLDTRTSWDFDTRLVYALASNWSLGVAGSSARAIRYNQEFRVEVTPAVEYSVFPYEEATRRAFTFYYKVGPAYRDYVESTIFGETEEIRWEQALEVRFSQRQPWGNASFGSTFSHFLHDFDRRQLSGRGNLRYRLSRGLSLNASAEIAWVDDQIFLSAEDVSDVEALLRLQQRATSFNYEMEVGFRFQFGSIFNNVVNNRFGRRF